MWSSRGLRADVRYMRNDSSCPDLCGLVTDYIFDHDQSNQERGCHRVIRPFEPSEQRSSEYNKIVPRSRPLREVGREGLEIGEEN